MTFPISAWGPDGRSVVRRDGPIAKTALYDGGYVSTPRELERRRKSPNAPRPSRSDKPSPEVGPQAEASPVGIDTGTPAGHEGRHEGGGCADVAATDHLDGQPAPANFRRSSPEASSTAGRANPTLGNLLHADMCADPSEARW